MNYPADKRNAFTDGKMAVVDCRPLDRAKAISGLIDEEALAGEHLGRLTDKVAAALLDANLFSIRLPSADGGLNGAPSTCRIGSAEFVSRTMN